MHNNETKKDTRKSSVFLHVAVFFKTSSFRIDFYDCFDIAV